VAVTPHPVRLGYACETIPRIREITLGDDTTQTGNHSESPRRYIIGLIVAHAVLVLFAVLTFSAGFTDYKWPRWQSIFIEALAATQIGLSSASLVIATVSLPVRIVALSIVLTFWLIVLNDLGLNQDYWLTIFTIQIAGIVLSLAIARLFGLQLIWDRCGTAETQLAGPAYHFSLRQMLYWTAAASFLLCLGTVLPHISGVKSSFDMGALPRAKTLGLSLFPITLVAVLGTLGFKQKITPFFVLVLVTVVASTTVARADQLYRTTWWSSLTHESYQTAYLQLVYLYATLVYLSVTVVRACGYRFAKRSRNT
jgi:hypothetical protein